MTRFQQAFGPRLARRRGQLHYPVGEQPSQRLEGQVREKAGQPGHVISGVEDDQDDQDGRVTLASLARIDQPHGHVADLRGSYRGVVTARAQPHRVQRRGPGRAARLQGGNNGPRIICVCPFPRTLEIDSPPGRGTTVTGRIQVVQPGTGRRQDQREDR